MTSPFPNPGPVEMALRERYRLAHARLCPTTEVVTAPPVEGVPLDLLAEPGWLFLAQLAALRHGVDIEELTNGSRRPAVNAARHELVRLLWVHVRMDGAFISRMIGRSRKHVNALIRVSFPVAGRHRQPRAKPAPTDPWHLPPAAPYDDVQPSRGTIPLSPTVILQETALHYGVSIVDIRSERRTKAVIPCRHAVMYRLRKETEMSLPKIGAFLGGRDHTTVIAGIKKHEARMAAAGKAVRATLEGLQ